MILRYAKLRRKAQPRETFERSLSRGFWDCGVKYRIAIKLSELGFIGHMDCLAGVRRVLQKPQQNRRTLRQRKEMPFSDGSLGNRLCN